MAVAKPARLVGKSVLFSYIAASIILASSGGEAGGFHVHLPTPKEVVHDAAKLSSDATKAATAPITNGAKVITGQESPQAAVNDTVHAQGPQFVDAGQAISTVNAATSNTEAQAVNDIVGKRAGAVLTIGVNANRVTTEFLATGLTATGEIIQGQDPRMLIATPLAAAMRAAEAQFLPQSHPLPPDVINALAPLYKVEFLESARWAIGYINLDLPDLVNAFVHRFQGSDNAMTVGGVSVFPGYPGNDYHWWAHEIGHQSQYKEWGIDQFAYNYVAACSQVEWQAENWAQWLTGPAFFNPPCPS